MSFRSIGGLPRCLRDRLILRRTSLSCDHTSCLRYSSSFAQATADEDELGSRTRVNNPLQAALSKKYGSSVASVEGVRYNETNRNRLLVNSQLNTRSPNRSQPHRATTAARVGGILETPSFIPGNTAIQQETGEGHGDKSTREQYRHNKHTLLEVRGRFQEWEDMHDEFLEVRRNRPADTARVFDEQINIMKSLVEIGSDTGFSASEFKRRWLALNGEERRKLLPSLLVGGMAESAAASLFVLSNIGSIPHAFGILMNCLRSIGLMYYKELQQDSALKRTYETILSGMRLSERWPEEKLPTVLLQTLLFWSDPEQCQKIIEDFLEKYPDAEASSLTAIVDHYLRIKDPDQAFHYLALLPTSMLQQPDTHVQTLRNRLLMLDHIVRSEGGTNFKYLPQLLALGIPSDEALHNTVIESAISNEMSDVAWDVYQYLEGSKFQSNARTHLVLLRDSFQRGDLQRVNDIMTAMHSRDDLTSDQYLVAYSMNIVRVISYFEKKLKPKEALSHIMALYDRAYDRTPLVKIGVVPPLAGSSELPMPSPTSLAFTIWTYTLIQRRDRDVVLRLWEWIKYLISNGDEAMLAAARFDIIYNGLILFHARSSTSLFRTFEVIQFMLSSKLCLPTSRTWSILLCSLLKYGQTKQAEKVLALMRSQGHKFEEISENYGKYLPAEHELQSMYDKVDQNLDERDMPAGIEELLAESKSLQGSVGSEGQSFVSNTHLE